RRADAIARNSGANIHDIAPMQISNCAGGEREPGRKLRARQFGPRRRRDIDLVKKYAVGLSMLAFGIRRLDHEIDKTAGNGYLSWRDSSTSDELLRLTDDETARVMRRLGDGERIQGHRLFFQRAIAVLVDSAGTKNADINLEAAIEHEVLAVNALDRDVVRCVVAGGLVDFATFDSGINESPEAA